MNSDFYSGRKKYFILAILLIVSVIWLEVSRLAGGKLKVDFLDIGQGDSIFITTPRNRHILIDGGPDISVLEELGEVLPFFNRQFDVIVLTHSHLDHVGGLLEVMKRYPVQKILTTGIIDDSPFYDEFKRLATLKKIPIMEATENSDFIIDGVSFDVLYPFTSLGDQTIANLNNASIVMKMTYGQTKIMLTGDAEEPVEKELLQHNLNLESDILKVGHHGSRTSTSLPFLKAVNPNYAVMEVGESNKYGHPHLSTLEKLILEGITYFRTDWNGRVEALIDGNGILKISAER